MLTARGLDIATVAFGHEPVKTARPARSPPHAAVPRRWIGGSCQAPRCAQLGLAEHGENLGHWVSPHPACSVRIIGTSEPPSGC